MILTKHHITPNLFLHARQYWMSLLWLCLAAPALAATPDKKEGKHVYDYVMEVKRATLAMVDSNVVVSFQATAIQDVPPLQSVVLALELIDTVTERRMELPFIFLNSRNQQIYFERTLKEDYPDALALRKQNGKDLNIDYLRTVKYEAWMEHAVLKLQKQSCACRNRKSRGEMIIASFDQDAVPVINLYPVYLLPPADNSVKVREESGSAYLCFEVNKWDIKSDYMSNPVELQKIHNSVNLVRNDSDVTIRKMTIEGFASPEGPEGKNLTLSEQRTEALKNYLQMSSIAKDIHIEATGKGENWDGFVQHLRSHDDVPQRDKLLSIATSNQAADEKERLMRREATEGFAYVVKNVFPALRCTNYTVVYTVRPFTLEESERVFEVRPVNLNLNEIYRLADKYADNKEKYYSIMRKAYMLYPNDSYINLTMAYLAIRRGDADEAEEYLSKVTACPEKTMNEGLVAYLKGDFATAVRLVQQAQLQGVREATEQLTEFGKLTK